MNLADLDLAPGYRRFWWVLPPAGMAIVLFTVLRFGGNTRFQLGNTLLCRVQRSLNFGESLLFVDHRPRMIGGNDAPVNSNRPIESRSRIRAGRFARRIVRQRASTRAEIKIRRVLEKIRNARRINIRRAFDLARQMALVVAGT